MIKQTLKLLLLLPQFCFLLLLVCCAKSDTIVSSSDSVSFAESPSDSVSFAESPSDSVSFAESPIDDHANNETNNPVADNRQMFIDFDEFENWLGDPCLQIDKPEDSNNARDYVNSIYSDEHKMFVVDRFYLSPIVPEGFEQIEIHLNYWEMNFGYKDSEGNELWYTYRTDGNIWDGNQNVATQKDDFSYFQDSLIKTSVYENQQYCLVDTPWQDCFRIYWYFDNYLCSIFVKKKSNLNFDYIPTVIDSETDISVIVDKINFKKVDLPPLQN